MNCEHLIRQLCRERKLTHKQWERLFSEYDDGDISLATELAREIAISRFGKRLWFRGIVEFSNICKQNCHYCGIRRDNRRVCRYRLTEEEILAQMGEEACVGRNGSPTDVAKAMEYLADADFITGHVLSVNGGYVI